MTRIVAALLVLLAALAHPAAAQITVQDVAQAAPVSDDASPDWELVASRAEKLTESGQASRFALRQIRAELIDWRTEHRTGLAKNAGRLATIARQLEALGPEPENGDADPQIAALRQNLSEEHTRLMRPQTLAQEAYARADGLIAEVDRIIRDRDTAALSERGASPLIPSNWVVPLTSLGAGLSTIWTETIASTRAQFSNGQLLGRGLLLLLILGVTIAILGPTRRWFASQAEHAHEATGTWSEIRPLLLSLGAVVVPIIALTVLAVALILSDMFGVLGVQVIANLPVAGGIVLIGKWLADRFFPRNAENDGVLGYEADTRANGRWLSISLAWVLAVWTIVSIAINTAPEAAYVTLRFPFIVVSALLLWRFGTVLAAPARDGTSASFTRGYLRNILGKLVKLAAALAPVAAIAGYGAAAWAAIEPVILSLAVLGALVVVQSVIYASNPEPVGEDEARSLLPVALSTVLILACGPILALIWGVRTSEMAELWTRFSSGFTVGETRISPTSFASFLIIFLIGYAITRFIKSTLKTTVMPRTKLDLGGQNAVVAGFGYVGILLSALVAFSVAGIDLSSLAIVAGALSVGIGFGLQTIVSNFVSGIILLIERPIGEGDMIEVNGQMGFVRDISVRSTRIETFDRTDVIVPNADLVSGQVINWTRGNLVGRAIVNVGVAYGSDTQRVAEILQEVANANPMVLLNPPPSVLLTGLGADSIDFEIRAILRDVNYVLSVKSELLHEVIRRLGEEGIEIPFAQRDIWLRNPEVLRPEGA